MTLSRICVAFRDATVGILLCTRVPDDQSAYAHGLLSRYQLELPDEARMRAFLEAQLHAVGGRRA